MDQQFLRVLLVDDDKENVARIRRITDAQRAPGIELLQTCDLQETTDALTTPGCDIVLLNLAAGDHSALGAYAVIAAHSPNTPVLALAPAELENLALRAVQNGASGYLITEQIYGTLLVRAIRHAVEQQRAEEKHRQTQHALRISEARYRSLFEQSHDAIVVTDADFAIVETNRATAELLGHPDGGLRGRALGDLHADREDGDILEQALRSDSAREIEVRLRRADGEIVWCLLSAAARRDDRGVTVGYQGILHDITQRKLAEERLMHAALHDSLTGLANRACFIDRLERAIARWRRNPDLRFAVLFMDLDRFKDINDAFGHTAGDAVLQHVARAMKASLRDEDTAARLGGDEFGVLIESVTEAGDATRASERIQTRLAEAFEVSGRRMSTSASIGIALPESLEQSAHDLLRNADIAMYRAKAAGTGQHEVFTVDLHRRALDMLDLPATPRPDGGSGDATPIPAT